MKRWLVGVLAAGALALPASAHAQPTSAVLDYVAVRFYAPETGGAAHPRFITERVLSFEAHLEAITEQLGAPVEERHVRAAVEHHIAEEMLSSLPLDPKPSSQDVYLLQQKLRAALLDRVGGQAALDRIAEADDIASTEIDALMLRSARAAMYLDRTIAPILNPSDEQLRTVFRTSAHPYRNGKTFEEVKVPLSRWFISERLDVAEQGFLQTARTRVKSFAIAR